MRRSHIQLSLGRSRALTVQIPKTVAAIGIPKVQEPSTRSQARPRHEKISKTPNSNHTFTPPKDLCRAQANKTQTRFLCTVQRQSRKRFEFNRHESLVGLMVNPLWNQRGQGLRFYQAGQLTFLRSPPRLHPVPTAATAPASTTSRAPTFATSAGRRGALGRPLGLGESEGQKRCRRLRSESWKERGSSFKNMFFSISRRGFQEFWLKLNWGLNPQIWKLSTWDSDEVGLFSPKKGYTTNGTP